jgi:hypothetical protein
MPAHLVAVRADGRRMGWSLLAANGRMVASSVARYGDDGEMLGAFRDLLLRRRLLTFGVDRDEARTWWWTAFLPASRPIARSSRGYLRQDQCRKATNTFLTALDQPPPGGWTIEKLVNSG